ncbi:unnamed protein product [Phytophthora lilii]|uniref:RxLR effector protein n=1 Tax=Phytophthora lilii TaxID=2077276 RepID=A0A9W6XFB1_9STRA|nr:unnamed protein product [Phytophthora lilii]
MRFQWIIVLAVAIILASTDALSDVKQAKITSFDTLQRDRALTTTEHDGKVPTKRFLRNRVIDTNEEDDEERAGNSEVANLAKKLSTKVEPAAAMTLDKAAKVGNLLKKAVF